MDGSGGVAAAAARVGQKPGTVVSGSSLHGPLLPGDRLVVRFEDDRNYGHERLVLWPVFAGDNGASEYVILTADGDMYSESLDDWNEAIVMTALGAYPARGMPPNLVQFSLLLEDTELSA